MDLPNEMTDILGQLSMRQQKDMLLTACDVLRDTNPNAEYVCDSWNDVFGVLDSFPTSRDEWVTTSDGDLERAQAEWVFRGQARSAWQLTTSLDRFTVEIDEISAEERLLREFQAKAGLYNAQIWEPNTKLEWLSLMQHYGAPTRLLDFTRSPYIAAYFALQDPLPKEGYATIWAIDLRRVREEMHRVYSSLSGIPRHASGLLKLPFEYIRVATELASLGNAERLSQLSSSGYIVPVELGREHVRLSNQQGLFLVNGAPNLSFEGSLRKMLGDSAKSALMRIAIKRSIREIALRKLQQMNINHLSLFPGFDGLAKFATMQAELFAQQRDPD